MSSKYPHPACFELDTLLLDCEFQRTRSFGPGGQHRNKVESAVVVTHLPTGISGQASERRSQHENRRKSIARLRINLALGYRLPIDESLRLSPSAEWGRRTAGGQIHVNIRHEDFPAMLAEALDVIHSRQFDASEAAKVLCCSSSQLIKLLRKEPAAITFVNRERDKLGLKKYR